MLSLSTMAAVFSTKASSTSRSTCARPAAITWSWTRLKISTVSIPLSMPRFSRLATPERMCSSRQRNIASWYSGSSRPASWSQLSSLPPGSTSLIRSSSLCALVRSTTVSTARLATNRTMPSWSRSPKFDE